MQRIKRTSIRLQLQMSHYRPRGPFFRLTHGQTLVCTSRIPMCAGARELLKQGAVQPADILEFYHGEVLAMRGKAKSFAAISVSETERGTPKFIKYSPRETPDEQD